MREVGPLDLKSNSFVLTVQQQESRHSTTLLDRRVIAAVSAALDSEVAAFLDQAYESRKEDYRLLGIGLDSNDWLISLGKKPQECLESVAVSVGLDNRTARSLQDKGRLTLLIERAIDEDLGRTGLVPSLAYDPTVEFQDKRGRLILKDIDAEQVAAVVLGPAPPGRGPVLVVESWKRPSAPYWGAANLLLIVMSLILAIFHISITTAVAAAAVIVVVDAVFVWWGYARGAAIHRLLLGLAPVTIVFAFAIAYAFWLIGAAPDIFTPPQSATTPQTLPMAPTWVDALLLSLAIASTGGFLDMQLRTEPVRWVAYLEMLLMVSVAGATIYGIAQAIWGALRDFGRQEG